MELCGPIYGLRRSETVSRTDSLLRLFDLTDSRKRFLNQCSHGMRKKTALAMALLHNPRVLFLDEPFEGIDPVASKTIRDLLTSISQRGITIFLTAHILSIVDRLADRFMMIQHGKIVWQSSREAVTQSLEDLYLDLVEAPQLEDLPWLQLSRS